MSSPDSSDLRPRVFVVDDDFGTRISVQATLEPEQTVCMWDDAVAALDAIDRDRPDLILLDLHMPGLDGIEFLRRLREMPYQPPVIVITGQGEDPVRQANELGAEACLIKPFDVPVLRAAVADVFAKLDLKCQLRALAADSQRAFPVDGLIGRSAAFRRALDHVEKAAASDANVIITGESGTGKEIVARRLHQLSARADAPFVPIHCAAIPGTLLESELFGHEKGAFTGAVRRHPGKLAQAGEGSIFFDELGDIPMDVQVKLLRVIQERQYYTLGGLQPQAVRARFIAATHRNLEAEVDAGRFREDLFYRFAVVRIHLPALRERREDIPDLVAYFLHQLGKELPGAPDAVSEAALQALCAYDWPGNVRELRNVMEGILVIHRHVERIDLPHLPERICGAGGGTTVISTAPPRQQTPGAPPVPQTTNLQDALDLVTRQMILDALDATDGNQSQAAKRLGTTRRILRYKMEKFGLLPEPDDAE